MNKEPEKQVSLRVASLIAMLGFIAVIAVNALANILPLNGVNTGVLSDEIPNLFVPAGLTFSVWGVIYLLLVGHIITIIRETWSKKAVSTWSSRDAFLFIVNMAANVAWIFAWHWRRVNLAMGVMLVIIGTLIALEQGNQRKLAAKSFDSRAKAFFMSVPLRVYLGWISVATIANATAVLVKSGWNGFGADPRFWTVAAIIAGLVVALGFSLWKKEVAAPMVVVWAYIGIVLKRMQTDSDYSSPVWIAAAVSAIVILLSFIPARLASLSGTQKTK